MNLSCNVRRWETDTQLYPTELLNFLGVSSTFQFQFTPSLCISLISIEQLLKRADTMTECILNQQHLFTFLYTQDITLIHLTLRTLFHLEGWDIQFLPSTSLTFISVICLYLFLNLVQTFLFPMIYDLPWFTIILPFCYQIHDFNTENPQNGVGKLQSWDSEIQLLQIQVNVPVFGEKIGIHSSVSFRTGVTSVTPSQNRAFRYLSTNQCTLPSLRQPHRLSLVKTMATNLDYSPTGSPDHTRLFILCVWCNPPLGESRVSHYPSPQLFNCRIFKNKFLA